MKVIVDSKKNEVLNELNQVQIQTMEKSSKIKHSIWQERKKKNVMYGTS